MDGPPCAAPATRLQTHSSLAVRRLIRDVCDEFRDFLIEKNESYGNSAFEALGVFSRVGEREGILLRIDDKLKRLKNGFPYPGDDTVKDLTGYLILLAVYDRLNSEVST